MRSENIKYILSILLIFAVTVAQAQRDTTLTQEVEVVKAYNPTISDANKINDMPKIEEEEHQKPTFNYSIFSQPIFNAFSVNELKAATVSMPPEENTGLGLVRAGLGNYNKPYGEVFFNSQNTKNTIFGLHGKHLSSHGKLKLEGGDKVKAPFSENEAEMFIKHLFRSSILSVNLDFTHNGFNYYGYPVDSIPAVLKEEDQEINYLGQRQTFSKGGINISLQSENNNRKDFTFDFNFLYDYFGTKTDQREHFGEFSADINKPLNTGSAILNAGITFVKADNVFNRHLDTMATSQQMWFTVKPAYYLGGDMANITIGFNTWIVQDNNADLVAKITPNVRLNFAPVKEIINIFAGVDGNYVNNHYSKIAYENPFIDPEHDVINSFERLHFYGGFDGKFATKTNFKLSVDYSMINEQPLYYLFEYVYPLVDNINNSPDPSIVDNDFKIMYDDMDLLKFNAEIFHTASEKLDLLLTGNYYVYKMNEQEQAWNLPDWDAKLSLGYKITDQLSVSSDIYAIGARTALILESQGFSDLTTVALPPIQKSYNLNTVIDMNFNASYKITQNFSLFGQLNNFGFQKYERWFGYPVQSFNFLAGLSYAF
ncbi:TonB-dependent receptor [Maribellus maritimus]|uniref:hypothetical protein n=1 Tax=Maribellus maritimus TaxID=2870838 RepID=UPI001EEC2C3A|nr:hypothetical protein [Maribellus maritimus]MCG6187151.1 hypothetical protein [Maribellus maritimus]